jgi:hypothetical protein
VFPVGIFATTAVAPNARDNPGSTAVKIAEF